MAKNGPPWTAAYGEQEILQRMHALHIWDTASEKHLFACPELVISSDVECDVGARMTSLRISLVVVISAERAARARWLEKSL